MNKHEIALKKHMEINNLYPVGGVAVDNQRHMYSVLIDGEIKKASYIATYNPMGEQEPKLVCSYGLIHEKEQFSYSSLTGKSV